MAVTVVCSDSTRCRLVFSGSLTYEFAREVEDAILDALHRYTHFEVDLAAVNAIDLCGLHLLALLQHLAGEAIQIVAHSETVELARQHLLASPRRPWLHAGVAA